MADEYICKQDAINTIMGQPPDAHYPSWYAAQIEDIPAADVVPVAEIYDAGYKGKEVQFRIGGRLFAISELAQ